MKIEVNDAGPDTWCFICNRCFDVAVITLHSEWKGTDETPLCLNCRTKLIKRLLESLPEDGEQE